MPVIDLTSWKISPHVRKHLSFTRYNENTGEIPSIISFHGHPVPSNRVEVFYIGEGRQHLRCMVSFKRRKANLKQNIIEEYYVFTFPAWQGTNDIIHLMEEAPGETYKAFTFGALLNIDRYIPVVERIKQQYSVEFLLDFAPEVLNFVDPVLNKNWHKVKQHLW
jgi:hypothetical protein